MHPLAAAALTALADQDSGPNPFGIVAIVVGVIILIILIVTLRR